jgi:hypothetical protein
MRSLRSFVTRGEATGSFGKDVQSHQQEPELESTAASFDFKMRDHQLLQQTTTSIFLRGTNNMRTLEKHNGGSAAGGAGVSQSMMLPEGRPFVSNYFAFLGRF